MGLMMTAFHGGASGTRQPSDPAQPMRCGSLTASPTGQTWPLPSMAVATLPTTTGDPRKRQSVRAAYRHVLPLGGVLKRDYGYAQAFRTAGDEFALSCLEKFMALLGDAHTERREDGWSQPQISAPWLWVLLAISSLTSLQTSTISILDR